MKHSAKLCLAVVFFVVVIAILFANKDLISEKFNFTKPRVEGFASVWTSSSKKMLHDTITTISSNLERVNIQWFAAGGTLLGSIRHGDVIAWDDDADIYVDKTEFLRNVTELSQSLDRDGYVLAKGNSMVPYKVYSKNAKNIAYNKGASKESKALNAKWPFVDIFFYDAIDTLDSRGPKIILYNDPKNTKHVFDWDVIFPLRKSPFGKRNSVMIPHRYEEVLTELFGNDYGVVCTSARFNHREEVLHSNVLKTDCDSVSKPSRDLKLVNIPAYVINLDRRPDRMISAENEFDKVGLRVDRFSAIDAQTPEFQNYYDELPTPKRKPGEVACALSHLEVLRDFLSSKHEYAFVFEDDIKFPPNITYKLLNKAFHNARGLKILLLGHCYSKDKKHTKKGLVFIGKGLCLHAYIVSRQGARDIIDGYNVSLAIDEVTKDLCDNTGGLCYMAGDISPKYNMKSNDGGLVYQQERDGKYFGSDILDTGGRGLVENFLY